MCDLVTTCKIGPLSDIAGLLCDRAEDNYGDIRASTAGTADGGMSCEVTVERFEWGEESFYWLPVEQLCHAVKIKVTSCRDFWCIIRNQIVF